MKKILFATLAIAALTACTNDNVLDAPHGEQIAFGNVFVDNVTRAAVDPSYGTNNSLTSIQVYGTVEGQNIFNNVTVTGTVGGGAWAQDPNVPVQYWIAGANYVFDAVVDANTVATDANGMPTTLSYNVADQKDMLYNRVTTVGKPTTNNGLVAFTFNHLLSKVKLTVKNETATAATNYSYKLTGITLTNAYTQGDYAVANGTWGNLTTATQTIDAMTVASGATEECAKEVLMIPGANIGISFNLEIWYNNAKITSTEVKKTGLVTLAANTSYNLNLTVGLDDQIKFTVTENPTWTVNPDVAVQ